jgi:predicted DNA-binding ArsR family transcriptional regulator
MEIVLRQELQHECRSIGHTIVDLAKQSESTITDEELDEVFKPLINMVQEKTQSLVELSLDEFRAELEDKAEENEMDDLLTTKRADILEYVMVSENGNAPERNKYHLYTRLKSTHNITITKRRPVTVTEITDDELINYPKDDPHWTQYLRSIDITFKDPNIYSIYQNQYDLTGICIEKDISYPTLCTHIDELMESGLVGKYHSIQTALTARDLRKARRAKRAEATKPY